MNTSDVVSGESSDRLSLNLSKQDLIYDNTLEYVYLDPSLEGNDLNINLMQKQINADNQYPVDERYVQTKKENIALQSHVHILEEQLHDTEFRCKEQQTSAERRHRDLVARINRSTRLSIDDYDMKLQNIEEANESYRSEVDKYKSILKTVQNEKTSLEHRLSDLGLDAQSFKDKIYKLESELRQSKQRIKENEEVIKRLITELDVCQLEKETMITELTAQLESLKHQNLHLKDSFDELQASTMSKDVEKDEKLQTKSLAAEFDELTHEDHNSLLSLRINKLETALKHQQEVNNQLHNYINNILTFH